jgi:hypothetical protein
MASNFYNFGGTRRCFWTAEDSAIMARNATRTAGPNAGPAAFRKVLGIHGVNYLHSQDADVRVIQAYAADRTAGFPPQHCLAPMGWREVEGGLTS